MSDHDVTVAVLPLKLVRPISVQVPFGFADSSGPHVDVVGGRVEDPTVVLSEAFAAQTPVHGAPIPELGIAVVPAELMVVLTKLGPLLLVPELNKLITLALGASRFNSKSPSKDSVAL